MPESSSMSGDVQPVVPPQLADSPTENKLWRKSKEAPFVPLGILGLLGAVTYGAMMYKKRGGMSTSVYIMKFRVISQGMVVGAITLGVGMSILPEIWKDITKKNNGSGKS